MFENLPVHVDLPVGLAGDVDVVEVPAVVFGVGSSQEQLTAGLSVRVPDKRGGRKSISRLTSCLNST